ncbi:MULTISPECIES: Fe-S cluster assembly protein HesB [Exiguobacterium]|uniref:Fe-S cluster assembly protein HesB n=1 Tax=Exiguobacterium TaxID=33986 RepID=UPI001BEA4FC2|nr:MULTISPECIES: Fe-S cluster assembly protein HesB [Exiguobacterium]MCT4775626.1 Fe-S cluster assembly protein HesB [Exiguobacterium aquaticum]MCT4787684.1 Fe-S cluster assembly protein HesB [Exiguobacterium mexicanum]
MNITNEAIDFMKAALAEEDIQSVRICTEAGCCGLTLGLHIAAPEASDDVKDFDGLTFAVAKDAEAMAENVTLDVESTEDSASLVLRGLQQTC